jgi:hypothetical protein
MALFDKDARNILIGVGVGVGVSALFPALASIFKDAGRPLAKASIKTGITAFEKGREKVAHWGEVIEDLVAESKAELEMEAQARQPAAPVPEQAPKVNGGP